MKQIDIFGNEIPVEELELKKNNGARKYKTMQQLYGELPEFKCKDCKHCVGIDYHRRTYYKCELWIMSHSEATDIRLKNVACKKFEKE